MKAELIARERRAHPEDRGFIEVIIWQVPRPVPPCEHYYQVVQKAPSFRAGMDSADGVAVLAA